MSSLPNSTPINISKSTVSVPCAADHTMLPIATISTLKSRVESSNQAPVTNLPLLVTQYTVTGVA